MYENYIMKSFCLTTYENNVITNRFMNFKSRGHHSFLHEVFAFIHLYVFLDSNVRFLSLAVLDNIVDKLNKALRIW